MRINVLIAASVIVFVMNGTSLASDDLVKDRMVNACIGEAEGEPYRGKLAVMCAIINRGGLHGVYGEKAKRVVNKLYPESAKESCTAAYYEALDVGTCDFIGGADHWEGTAFPEPSWAKDMIVTATIANQKFYKRR